MARVAFLTRVIDEAGNAIGGSGTEVRIWDDFGATSATVVTADTAGAITITQPITPNAGTQTTLAVTTAAVDTTITVASTTGFAVGQIVPIYDGTTTKYRWITAILAGPPRLTLETAIGVIFSNTNTSVGNPDMQGVIAGYVSDSTFHYVQTKDVASTRVMPPTLIPTMIGNSSVAVQEEGGATGTRPTINFKGTAITAVDNAPSTRVDVTVGGDFTDQTFIKIGTNPAASGVLRLPNAGYVTSRNGANSSDVRLLALDGSNAIDVGDPGIATPSIGLNAASVRIPGYAAVAASGHIRLPTGPTISNRNAANTGDEQIWPHLTANAALGADVTITTAGTFYDGPSVSLGIGVWLIVAKATVSGTASNGFTNAAIAKLWDGTTVADSGETAFNNDAGGGPRVVTVTLSAIVTLASITTYKISCTLQSTGAGTGLIRAATPDSGSGNNASRILAVRIG